MKILNLEGKVEYSDGRWNTVDIEFIILNLVTLACIVFIPCVIQNYSQQKKSDQNYQTEILSTKCCTFVSLLNDPEFEAPHPL